MLFEKLHHLFWSDLRMPAISALQAPQTGGIA
jgi:hypothetical protein